MTEAPPCRSAVSEHSRDSKTVRKLRRMQTQTIGLPSATPNEKEAR